MLVYQDKPHRVLMRQGNTKGATMTNATRKHRNKLAMEMLTWLEHTLGACNTIQERELNEECWSNLVEFITP